MIGMFCRLLACAPMLIRPTVALFVLAGIYCLSVHATGDNTPQATFGGAAHLVNNCSQRINVSPAASCVIPAAHKFDCGYLGINQQQCESKGCCWSPVGPEMSKDVPWCYHPLDHLPDYQVATTLETDDGETLHLNLSRGGLTHYGEDKVQVDVAIMYETADRVHLTLSPPDERWTVPQEVLPRPPPPTSRPPGQQYWVTTAGPGESFSLNISRTTSCGPSAPPVLQIPPYTLMVKDQLLVLTISIPQSMSIYGIGESTRSSGLRLPRDGRLLTLWNTDQLALVPDQNLYGSHPFYLAVDPHCGEAHGVMVLSSNGMDVVMEGDSLEFRVIGGLLDVYVFLGPDPEAVIQQYQEVIGRPAMIPRWSLGFHQCRWGYKDLDELHAVVVGYREAGLPLEVIWSDIDYMDGYRDFTLDPNHYPADRMRGFIDSLHANHQHWVPIIDAGIPPIRGDVAYEEGIQEGVFVRDVDGNPYLGKVWPGPTHWPDFLNPRTPPWWQRQLQRLYDMVPYDGIWLDMNEPSNFVEGEACHLAGERTRTRRLRGGPACKAKKGAASSTGSLQGASQDIACRKPPETDPWAYPPYAINALRRHAHLGYKTLAANALHYGDIRHYNAHNLYGLVEAKVTATALKNITGRRPFLLSRSTFPGSGRYTAHWTGDNAADWQNLKWSISGIINSNLWGIPLAGADICGFSGDTNEELCTRWISAGAFYPFSRNHNSLSQVPQELYRWPMVAQAAKKALGMRYRLLPYLYTTFYRAATQGGTVARPLVFVDPSDEVAHMVDDQWLLGEGLMISPVVEPHMTSRSVYFPKGWWYDMWGQDTWVQGPCRRDVPSPLGHVPIYLRGGVIVPLQDYAGTTREVAQTNVTLILALPLSLAPVSEAIPDHKEADKQSLYRPVAVGYLYMDNGDSLDVGGYDALLVEYKAEQSSDRGNGRLTGVVHVQGASRRAGQGVFVNQVSILGVDVIEGLKVVINDVEVEESKLTLDPAAMRADVLDVGLEVGQGFSMVWTTPWGS